jgi:RHS repeat-associated protein
VQEALTTLGQFYYNYAGLRTQKTANNKTSHYSYDGDSVLTQSDTSNATTVKYDYGAEQLLSLKPQSTARQYYHNDALGSTTLLTTATGNQQASYQYDAWGNSRGETGTSDNVFGFTGHEKDSETGLYYFKARYYDPDTARFLNQDSYLGDVNTPPSLHRYLYAYGNPTVWVDLDGYKSVFGDASQQIDSFNNWLTGKNRESDSHVIGAAVGVAKFFTTASKAITGGLDIAANVAQTAVGVDDQQVRDELAATRGAVTDGIDFAVNGDYGKAIGNAYGAAVNRTTQAFEGDVTATSDIVEVVVGVALGRAKAKQLGKPKAKNIEESHTRTGVVEKPTITQGGGNRLETRNRVAQTIPNAEKKLLAMRKYKETQGITGKLSPEQYSNFRRGNAGDNGGKLYAKKGDNVVPTPQANRHGNTLNDVATTIYKQVDVNGDFLKYGVAKDHNKRYSLDTLDGGRLLPSSRQIPRTRAIKIERFLTERNPGPLNKEPWAGKRKPGHENYDPDYKPWNMRKE